MTTITSFISRLKKIGIQVELSSNYPWLYLDKVNGYEVHEPFYSNHCFTVFFQAVRNDQVDRITDIGVVFKKIRQMLTEEGRKEDYKKYSEFIMDYRS